MSFSNNDKNSITTTEHDTTVDHNIHSSDIQTVVSTTEHDTTVDQDSHSSDIQTVISTTQHDTTVEHVSNNNDEQSVISTTQHDTTVDHNSHNNDEQTVISPTEHDTAVEHVSNNNNEQSVISTTQHDTTVDHNSHNSDEQTVISPTEHDTTVEHVSNNNDEQSVISTTQHDTTVDHNSHNNDEQSVISPTEHDTTVEHVSHNNDEQTVISPTEHDTTVEHVSHNNDEQTVISPTEHDPTVEHVSHNNDEQTVISPTEHDTTVEHVSHINDEQTVISPTEHDTTVEHVSHINDEQTVISPTEHDTTVEHVSHSNDEQTVISPTEHDTTVEHVSHINDEQTVISPTEHDIVVDNVSHNNAEQTVIPQTEHDTTVEHVGHSNDEQTVISPTEHDTTVEHVSHNNDEQTVISPTEHDTTVEHVGHSNDEQTVIPQTEHDTTVEHVSHINDEQTVNSPTEHDIEVDNVSHCNGEQTVISPTEHDTTMEHVSHISDEQTVISPTEHDTTVEHVSHISDEQTVISPTEHDTTMEHVSHINDEQTVISPTEHDTTMEHVSHSNDEQTVISPTEHDIVMDNVSHSNADKTDISPTEHDTTVEHVSNNNDELSVISATEHDTVAEHVSHSSDEQTVICPKEHDTTIEHVNHSSDEQKVISQTEHDTTVENISHSNNEQTVIPQTEHDTTVEHVSHINDEQTVISPTEHDTTVEHVSNNNDEQSVISPTEHDTVVDNISHSNDEQNVIFQTEHDTVEEHVSHSNVDDQTVISPTDYDTLAEHVSRNSDEQTVISPTDYDTLAEHVNHSSDEQKVISPTEHDTTVEHVSLHSDEQTVISPTEHDTVVDNVTNSSDEQTVISQAEYDTEAEHVSHSNDEHTVISPTEHDTVVDNVSHSSNEQSVISQTNHDTTVEHVSHSSNEQTVIFQTEHDTTVEHVSHISDEQTVISPTEHDTTVEHVSHISDEQTVISPTEHDTTVEHVSHINDEQTVISPTEHDTKVEHVSHISDEQTVISPTEHDTTVEHVSHINDEQTVISPTEHDTTVEHVSHISDEQTVISPTEYDTTVEHVSHISDEQTVISPTEYDTTVEHVSHISDEQNVISPTEHDTTVEHVSHISDEQTVISPTEHDTTVEHVSHISDEQSVISPTEHDTTVEHVSHISDEQNVISPTEHEAIVEQEVANNLKLNARANNLTVDKADVLDRAIHLSPDSSIHSPCLSTEKVLKHNPAVSNVLCVDNLSSDEIVIRNSFIGSQMGIDCSKSSSTSLGNEESEMGLSSSLPVISNVSSVTSIEHNSAEREICPQIICMPSGTTETLITSQSKTSEMEICPQITDMLSGTAVSPMTSTHNKSAETKIFPQIGSKPSGTSLSPRQQEIVSVGTGIAIGPNDDCLNYTKHQTRDGTSPSIDVLTEQELDDRHEKPSAEFEACEDRDVDTEIEPSVTEPVLASNVASPSYLVLHKSSGHDSDKRNAPDKGKNLIISPHISLKLKQAIKGGIKKNENTVTSEQFAVSEQSFSEQNNSYQAPEMVSKQSNEIDQNRSPLRNTVIKNIEPPDTDNTSDLRGEVVVKKTVSTYELSHETPSTSQNNNALLHDSATIHGEIGGKPWNPTSDETIDSFSSCRKNKRKNTKNKRVFTKVGPSYLCNLCKTETEKSNVFQEHVWTHLHVKKKICKKCKETSSDDCQIVLDIMTGLRLGSSNSQTSKKQETKSEPEVVVISDDDDDQVNDSEKGTTLLKSGPRNLCNTTVTTRADSMFSNLSPDSVATNDAVGNNSELMNYHDEKQGYVHIECHGNDQQNVISSSTTTMEDNVIDGGLAFPCGIRGCDYSGTSFNVFKKHLETFHRNEDTYPCVFCSKVSISSNEHLHHLKNHQKPVDLNASFICGIHDCEFKDKDFQNFIKHLYGCHGNAKLFPCFLCKENFSSVEEMLRHCKTNLSKMIHCPHCAEQGTNRSEILKHISELHPGMTKQIKVTSQLICSDNRSNSREDVRLSTSINTDLNFPTKMAQHSALDSSHSANRNETSISLARDLNLSAVGELRKCPRCSYVGQTDVSLQEHSLLHNSKNIESNKPFQCQECPDCQDTLKAFKDHMNCHIGTHKLVLYYCEICGFVSNVSDILTSHIISTHPFSSSTVMMSTKTIKISSSLLACACGYVAASEEQFYIHMENHTKETYDKSREEIVTTNINNVKRPFSIPAGEHYPVLIPCSECPFTTNRRSQLIIHISKHSCLFPRFEDEDSSTEINIKGAEKPFDNFSDNKPGIDCTNSGVDKLISFVNSDGNRENENTAMAKSYNPEGNEDLQDNKSVYIGSDYLHEILQPYYGSLNSPSDNYSCKFCELTIKSKYQIHKHILKHLNVWMYQCGYCKYKVIESSNLHQHIHNTHGSLPFKHIKVRTEQLQHNVSRRAERLHAKLSLSKTSAIHNKHPNDSEDKGSTSKSYRASKKNDTGVSEMSLATASESEQKNFVTRSFVSQKEGEKSVELDTDLFNSPAGIRWINSNIQSKGLVYKCLLCGRVYAYRPNVKRHIVNVCLKIDKVKHRFINYISYCSSENKNSVMPSSAVNEEESDSEEIKTASLFSPAGNEWINSKIKTKGSVHKCSFCGGVFTQKFNAKRHIQHVCLKTEKVKNMFMNYLSNCASKEDDNCASESKNLATTSSNIEGKISLRIHSPAGSQWINSKIMKKGLLHKCSLCGAAFAKRTNVRRHIIKVCLKTEKGKTMFNNYLADRTDKQGIYEQRSFPTMREKLQKEAAWIKANMKKIGNNVSCRICNYKSPFQRNLKRHIMDTHKNLRTSSEKNIVKSSGQINNSESVTGEITVKETVQSCGKVETEGDALTAACKYSGKQKKNGKVSIGLNNINSLDGINWVKSKVKKDDKYFRCHICGFKSVYSHCIRRHIKNLHSEIYEKTRNSEQSKKQKKVKKYIKDISSESSGDNSLTNKVLFQCLGCKGTYESMTTLQTHFRQYCNKTVYGCTLCSQYFSFKESAVKQHSSALHGKKIVPAVCKGHKRYRKYYTPQCSARIPQDEDNIKSNKASVKCDSRRNSQSTNSELMNSNACGYSRKCMTQFCCENCKLVSQNMKDFQNHYITKHNSPLLVCAFCTNFFSRSIWSFKLHTNRSHPKAKNLKFSFRTENIETASPKQQITSSEMVCYSLRNNLKHIVCKTCNYIATSLKSFTVHHALHHKGMLLNCLHCKKVKETNIEGLRNHNTVMHKHKQLRFTYIYPSQKVDTNVENSQFVCSMPECQFRCQISVRFRQHLYRHLNYRPYCCKHCSFSSHNYKSTLNHQNNLHSEKKNSGLRVVKNAEIEEKVQNLMKRTNKEPSERGHDSSLGKTSGDDENAKSSGLPQNLVKCPYCGRLAYKRMQLVVHIRRCHPNEKVCTVYVNEPLKMSPKGKKKQKELKKENDESLDKFSDESSTGIKKEKETSDSLDLSSDDTRGSDKGKAHLSSRNVKSWSVKFSSCTKKGPKRYRSAHKSSDESTYAKRWKKEQSADVGENNDEQDSECWYSCHLCSYSTNDLRYFSRHLVCHDTFTHFIPGEKVESPLIDNFDTGKTQSLTFLCSYCCYYEDSLPAMRQHRDRCHPYSVFDCIKMNPRKTEVLVNLQSQLNVEDICKMDLMKLATILEKEGVRMKSNNQNESYCATEIVTKKKEEEVVPRKRKQRISIFTKSKLMKYNDERKMSATSVRPVDNEKEKYMNNADLKLVSTMDTEPGTSDDKTKGDNSNPKEIPVTSGIDRWTDRNDGKGDNLNSKKAVNSDAVAMTNQKEHLKGDVIVQEEISSEFLTLTSKNKGDEVNVEIEVTGIMREWQEEEAKGGNSENLKETTIDNGSSENVREVQLGTWSMEQKYVPDEFQETRWPGTSSSVDDVVEISSDSDDESANYDGGINQTKTVNNSNISDSSDTQIIQIDDD